MIIRDLEPKGIPYMHPLEQQLSTVAAVEVSGTMPFTLYGSRGPLLPYVFLGYGWV